MGAQEDERLVARVDVTADVAKLRPGDARLNPARWHDARPDPVLATLAVDHAVRAELAWPQEARPLDRPRLVAPRHQR